MRLALLYEKTHCSVVAMLMAIFKGFKNAFNKPTTAVCGS